MILFRSIRATLPLARMVRCGTTRYPIPGRIDMTTQLCVTCKGDEWAQEHGWSRDVPAVGERSCCHAAQCDSCLSRFTCAECGE